MYRIPDIGKGVLKQKIDVACIWKGEKQALIGPGSINFSTDSFSSEDEKPLAELLSPKQKEATTTTKGIKVGIVKTAERITTYKKPEGTLILDGNHDFDVSPQEMYKHFGILILSGNKKLPHGRM
ncbi:hypothetical protein HHI36_023896, partial [Cryptolaemus montrouzieri]